MAIEVKCSGSVMYIGKKSALHRAKEIAVHVGILRAAIDRNGGESQNLDLKVVLDDMRAEHRVMLRSASVKVSTSELGLLKMLKEDKSQAEIAAHYGLTHQEISRKALRLSRLLNEFACAIGEGALPNRTVAEVVQFIDQYLALTERLQAIH